MKKSIKLTEEELHQLIENTVYDILNEGEKWDKFKKNAKKVGKETGKLALQTAVGGTILGGALLGRDYLNQNNNHSNRDNSSIVDRHERQANKEIDKKTKQLGRDLTKMEIDDIYNSYHSMDESIVKEITNIIKENLKKNLR